MSEKTEILDRIKTLEETIRLLQMENEQLAERAEDTLLLGLIAEEIGSAEDPLRVLEKGLERISILKDIPFCACCSLKDERAVVVASFLSFSHKEMAKTEILLPPAVAKGVVLGSVLLNGQECEEVGMRSALQSEDFIPCSTLLIPFISRYAPASLFLFADNGIVERFSGMNIMLHRVVEMMVAKMDNLLLVKTLKELNIELDRKVEDRTKELMGSEGRLRTAFATIQDLIMISDSSDGRIIDCNGRQVGYAREEMIGKTLAELGVWVNTKDRKRFINTINAKGHVEDFEALFRRKDGTVFIGSVSTNVLKMGTQSHLLSVTRDVTERKRVEEVRRLNESRLETLLQLNQMTGSTLQEIAGYVMEEAVRLTQSDIGYVAFMNADETVLTMHAWSLKAMQQCRIVHKPLEYPIETTGLWGEAVRQRRPIITNDYYAPNPLKRGIPPGHVAVHRHMNVPIFDGERIVIVAGVGNKPADYDEADIRQLTLLMTGMWRIVQRKRTEEALRISEEKYRLVVENANDAIFIVQDGFIKFPNPRMVALVGYSLEELTQEPFLEFVHPEDRELVAATHQRRMRGDEVPNTYSFRVVSKSGETLWVALSSVIITWDGKIASLNFLRDITVEKKLESQLLHARKMESIGTLAGGIAHDFNNILAAIIGYTEMALQKASEHSLMRSDLTQVLAAGHRARDLVKQILTFSRMRTGNGSQEVDVGRIIREALKFLRASLPATIEIRHNIESRSAMTLGDPTQIHEVLMNLCTNAAHAMEEKGGVLGVGLTDVVLDSSFVSLYPNAKPGPYLRLTVSDTGHGMDAETMEHIFEPYFTTKDVGKGTGFGLAVVHGIINHHGGLISVQSELGQGTTVHAYLPSIDGIGSVDEEAEVQIPGGTEKILFVDDEEMLADMAKAMLGELGYKIMTKTNSTEALHIFRNHPYDFDLIITDYTMPHLTGMDLAREILQVRPDIPVVLLTGFNERASQEKAREMGIREFAMKPLDMRSLAILVRKVLDPIYNKLSTA